MISALQFGLESFQRNPSMINHILDSSVSSDLIRHMTEQIGRGIEEFSSSSKVLSYQSSILASSLFSSLLWWRGHRKEIEIPVMLEQTSKMLDSFSISKKTPDRF